MKTNEELLKRYENELIMNDKAPNTIEAYVRHIRLALEAMNVNVCDVDYFVVSDYIISLKGKLVQDTINKKIQAINDFMAFCNRAGITSNEVKIQMVKDKDRYNRQLNTKRIDSDMYYKIIERNEEYYAQSNETFGNVRERVVLNFLIYGGMRKSEIYNLKMEDVQVVVKEGDKVLRVAINDTKYNKSRVIYLNEEILPAITDWRIQRKKYGLTCEYFLCSKKSRRMAPTAMDRIAKTVTDRAELYDENDEKLTFTCHAFRHAVGSMLLKDNNSIADIAEFLGDTIEVVMKTYVHADKATIHNITDGLFKR